MEVEVVCCLFQPSVASLKIPSNSFLCTAQEENDCAVSSRKQSAHDFTWSVERVFLLQVKKLKISQILRLSWKKTINY